MRVIDTRQFAVNRKRLATKRKRVRRGFLVVAASVLLSGYSYIAYQRPLPDAPVTLLEIKNQNSTPTKLAWPSYGQAAVGTSAYGLLSATPDQSPKPTASVAKVMTAVSVLKKMPLKVGEQGPVITLGEADVAAYEFYGANEGSRVLVENGEQITQYQALQALLLPSANNMADSLARWAFGSLEAYNDYANALAKQLHMTKTTIADASGFSAATVSTSSDLVRLGLAAMQDSVISEIVGQTEASIPVAGQIRSTNRLLGQKDYIGIKTGNTDEAGGCYLFATTHTFNGGQKIVLVGAIMAAPALGTAMNDSVALADSAYAGFQSFKLVSKGQKVGTYKFSWGETNEAVAKADINVFVWQDELVDLAISLDPLPVSTGTNSSIGTITATTKFGTVSSELRVLHTTKPPSPWWRLSSH